MYKISDINKKALYLSKRVFVYKNSKTVLTGLYTKRNIAPSDPETEKIKINAEDE